MKTEQLKFIVQGENVRSVILEDDLFEMADILGKRVNTDVIDFSFYIGTKDGNKHGIRAKICWNRDHYINGDGVMELHGSYEYFSDVSGEHVKSSKISDARKFFKKYKVFIAAIWEKCLDADDFREFLKGAFSFDDLIHSFYFDCSCFDGVDSIPAVEDIVREKRLFNLND